ncbi:uncharacterized protein LOC110453512 [Mizuhopecten yessoensis]|uniref:uncharacterized protein LOC110453512 n=1 Tax=Mizuhopecten yessoensis TaxID=6573 RepID=UPI000B45E0DD|nr:uncharacterized protein LOC110453512 [Mizuhopecten yessoensis]
MPGQRSGGVAILAALFGLLSSVSGQSVVCNQPSNRSSTVYDFPIRDLYYTQKTLHLSDYRGKVLLVVNVATYLGQTSQYYGLNALQNDYGSRGLQVLGVPCNQLYEVHM